MKKVIITVFILFLTLYTFSQKDCRGAVLSLRNGQYAKADSLFTEYLSNNKSDKNALFNRAIARINMNNMAGFCKDMRKLKNHSDEEAATLYCEKCVDIDTVYYDSYFVETSKKNIYVEIIHREKYSNYAEGKFYKNKKLIANYSIEDNYKCFSDIPDKSDLRKVCKQMMNKLHNNAYIPDNITKELESLHIKQLMIYAVLDISKFGKITHVKIFKDNRNETQKKYCKYLDVEIIKALKKFSTKKRLSFMGECISFRLTVPFVFKF